MLSDDLVAHKETNRRDMLSDDLVAHKETNRRG
jgi:hypothetical protein